MMARTLKEVLEQARDASVVPPRRINRHVPRSLDESVQPWRPTRSYALRASADAVRLSVTAPHQLVQQTAPVAILVALLVPAWVMWPVSVRTAREGPDATITERVTREPTSEPKQGPSSGVRVTRFDIPHFPKLDATRYDPQTTGLLGKKSFSARVEDDVIVRADLSEPAYSYLIAFRPDGTDELCGQPTKTTLAPDAKAAVPPFREERRALSLERGDRSVRFRAGCVAPAAAVVSRMESPERANGMVRRLPYSQVSSGSTMLRGLQPLMADDSTGTRGKGAKARDSGEPAAKLASWLRGLPGVDAVTVEAFPVEPAAGP